MKYTFHHYSRLHYALLVLFTIIIFFFIILFILLLDQSSVIIPFLIASIIWIALVIYLPKKLTKATIEAIIENDLLILDFIKPAWGTDQKTIYIYFKDLISYKYEYSTNLDLFKLTLSDGSVIKINRTSEDDDFDNFYDDFKKIVENYNRPQNIKPIILEKRFNEKFSFLIPMTSLFGLLLTFGVYMTFFTASKDPKKIFALIVSAVLFFSFLARTIEVKRKQ